MRPFPARLAALCLALAAPLSAAADAADKAEALLKDYRAAYAAYGPRLMSRDPAVAMQETAAMIERLEGRWAPLSLLAGDSDTFATGQLDIACERSGQDLIQTGPLRFDMVRTWKDGTVTYHYSLAAGGEFQRDVDPEELFAMLLGPKAQEPEMRARVFAALPRGTVFVLHPSPDILVLRTYMQPVEIWGRCP